MNLKTLSNSELLKTTKILVTKERKALTELLKHLIEIEDRRLYLKQGYSSMFDYINRGLEYSKPAASRRLKAARCLRDNPKALDMLKSGKLSLSTICQASAVIKQDNAPIERFIGVSAREAEQIASEYKPAPKKKIKDSIKPIGRKREAINLPLLEASCSDVGTDLVPAKHIVRFEASSEFTEKLEEVRTVAF